MAADRRKAIKNDAIILPFINRFNYQYYSRDTFTAFLKHFRNAEVVRIRKGKVYQRYYNIPCACDIEVSSFYDDQGEKTALMYVWQICINGYCWFGRTYNELYDMFRCCHDVLNLGYTKRLVFFVHNLSYEWNNLRKYMTVTDYFAIDKRTPLYVQTADGVEFRCSYQLSGYSLAYLGKNELHKYHVEKAVGDLNYNLIRTKDTVLTRKEMGYIINDVRVVTNYIQELIERGEDIAHIPLTKTGRVRRKLVDDCVKKDGHLNKSFIHTMQQCTLTADEYYICKSAFMGGFTHSNPLNTGIHFKEDRAIIPHDIASDYPHVMVTCKFPMGKAKHVKEMTLDEYLTLAADYHIIAEFTFTGLQATFIHDYYISRSKCFVSSNVRESNGRIVSADEIMLHITEVDFDIIRQMYEWNSVTIRNCLIYESDYLPREYVLSVLDLYEKKTVLKGQDEKKIEYQMSKALLNSTYGCMCTDIIRKTYSYDDDFVEEEPDVAAAIETYNSRKKRTNFYPWAVYVTAHARHKLLSSILKLGSLYVYADTDSIYAFDCKEVREHFAAENGKIIENLKFISWLRDMPIEKFSPCDQDGHEHPLGVWELETRCIEFKTLGAKRYMKTYEDGSVHTTIAGLSKSAVSYITQQGGYNFFKNGMSVPETFSGRTTVTYIDELKQGSIKDYQGHETPYSVRTGVHMEASDYTLSMSSLFMEFIRSIMI